MYISKKPLLYADLFLTLTAWSSSVIQFLEGIKAFLTLQNKVNIAFQTDFKSCCIYAPEAGMVQKAKGNE